MLRKLAVLFFPFLFAAAGQSILDVSSIVQLALKTPVVVQTVVGIDTTTCTLTKEPGATIWLVWGCTGASPAKTAQILPGTVATGAMYLNGQAACLIGLNPTNAPVTMGSLGSVPANGAAWQCSTGGLAILSGTATWP
jgi:hypothetical protein